MKNILLIIITILLIHPIYAQKLEHIPTTVPHEEFSDRLKLYVLKNPDKAKKGIVDVTAQPYGAKGNGVTDDTNAIQNAIDDAYLSNFVVVLPADKIYLISRQISLLTGIESRRIAHQFVGASNGKRPILKLKDKSDVEGNILVYYFYNGQKKSKDAVHYGATFRNIDIDMGNNPEVSALSMSGAQHCVIEDTKIFGESFKSGIYNLPGSGGGAVNVHIVGGEIGIDQEQHRPNPTIEGLVLEGQTKYGIKMKHLRGPLVISGFKIIGSQNENKDYKAIYLDHPQKGKVTEGIVEHGNSNLSLTDGNIEVKGISGVAISNVAQDLTFENVYIKAAKMIENGVGFSSYSILKGSPNNWKKLSKYAFTSKLDKSSVMVKGKKLNDRSSDFEYSCEVINEAPREILYTKHSYGNIPDFSSQNMVSITEYGATTEFVNADDNDALAIQRAIDDVANPASDNFNKTVFIPRGYFDLATPIVVKKGVKLIGVAKNISTLQVKNPWENTLGAIITTENDNDGNIILSDFSILGFCRMSYLRVQSGNTIIRDIITEDKFRYVKNSTTSWKINEREQPYIDFCNNAGGKAYHISLDHISLKDRGHVDERLSSYNQLRIKDTHNPLHLYQVSIEHHHYSPQVMIDHANNLKIFGLKYEGPSELLNIYNSNNVLINGGSGNYFMEEKEDRGIIVIENSKDISIRNLCYSHKTKIFGRELNNNIKYWIVEGKKKLTNRYSILWFEGMNSRTVKVSRKKNKEL